MGAYLTYNPVGMKSTDPRLDARDSTGSTTCSCGGEYVWYDEEVTGAFDPFIPTGKVIAVCDKCGRAAE